MDLIRQELDELMGKDRDLTFKERMKKKEHYDDPDVCKYNLVSFCPHDLFPNTKCDLGKHDEYLKRMFLEDPNRISFEKRYLNEMINLIESLLSGIDAKVKKTKNKLENPNPDMEKPREIQDKIDAIDEEIKWKLFEFEKLGEQGKIDQAEDMMMEVEKLKKRKDDLVHLGENPLSTFKTMRVCEICGALQAINDTEKRQQTHLEGKLHTGFYLLRKELDILKLRREEIRNNPKKKSKSRESRKKHRTNRSRSRKKRDKGSPSKSKSKRKKEKKHKEKEKRKEKDKEKEKNNDKEEGEKVNENQNENENEVEKNAKEKEMETMEKEIENEIHKAKEKEEEKNKNNDTNNVEKEN